MRGLSHLPPIERARLESAGVRLYPGLLPGGWYDVVPGSEDEIGGFFLVVGSAERYVRREWFQVESIEGPGPE